MGQPCRVCTHPQRVPIDEALVSGAPNRRIAAQYALTEQAVRRHKAAHLPAQLAQAQDALDVAQAGDLVAQLLGYRRRADALLAQAEQAKEIRNAVACIAEARHCLELEAKLRGELDERAQVQVNLVASAEWVMVRTAILRALEPYGEARVAVAQALVAVEGPRP